MKSTHTIAACFAALSLLAFGNLSAVDHPFHASTASVSFNPETSSLEVSLCVFPDDFAVGVVGPGESPLRYADTERVDKVAQRYLRERFQVWIGDRPLQPHWVGHELATQHLWLYFEFPVERDELPGLAFRNSLLQELFEDQANDVTVTIQERCRTLTFRAEHSARQSFATPD